MYLKGAYYSLPIALKSVRKYFSVKTHSYRNQSVDLLYWLHVKHKAHRPYFFIVIIGSSCNAGEKERENAREGIFQRCYDYAPTLEKSLDIEPDMPGTAGRQIHCDASTPFDYYLRHTCLPLFDHLIEGLNTSSMIKYGSMIHKMHAFVPSVIEIGKKEGNNKIEEIIHKYRNELPTPGKAFEEYSRNDDGKLFRSKINLILCQKH